MQPSANGVGLDRSLIGAAYPPRPITVEAGQLCLFLKAIGQPHERQWVDGAEVPLTFGFCLQLLAEGDQPAPDWVAGGGSWLHAEQEFSYLRPIRVGDRLRVDTRIADIYEKAGGTLEFIALESTITTQTGDCCVLTRTLLARRRPAVAPLPL